MYFLGILTFVFLHLFASRSWAQKVVEMLSPYDSPPFVISEKNQTGLVYGLASFLNTRSGGKYKFKVVVVPRARVSRILERGGLYVIPLVAPQWFGDREEKKYLWTSTLMEDENLVLSPRKKALVYEGPESFKGKSTAVVLGHSVEPLKSLAKSGEVIQGSTNSLDSAMKMVANGRVDFLVMGRMVALYLVQSMGLEKDIYISDKAVERFERKILISPEAQKDLQIWLEGEIQRLRRSGEWKKYLRAYYDNLDSSDLTQNANFI